MRVFLVLIFLFPSWASALCVNQEKANLRFAPALKAPKTWEVIRYTPLKKLAKKNGWYRVEDVDQKIHWVREDLVTSSFSCATIKSEFANLRKGPGTNFPKVKAGQGEKYLSFRVVKTKGRWIQLEDIEGDTVWAARENLWIQ